MTRYIDVKTKLLFRDKGDFVRSGTSKIMQFQKLNEKTEALFECMNILGGVAYYADPITTKDEKEKLNEAKNIIEAVYETILQRKLTIMNEFIDVEWTERLEEGSIIKKEEEE